MLAIFIIDLHNTNHFDRYFGWLNGVPPQKKQQISQVQAKDVQLLIQGEKS